MRTVTLSVGIKITSMQSKPLQFQRRAGRMVDKVFSAWRRLSRAPQKLLYSLYVDEHPDYRASVLLTGSGRGGTTWLAEVINFDNSYRFMFEPFNHARVRQCAAFNENQYLRPDNSDTQFLNAARLIFSGRLRNGWVDAFNRKLRVSRRLIKDIRTNLLLGWIRAHFPQMPIILLLRHPCAVAYSRCRSGWPVDLEARFYTQPALVQDYLQPFRAQLKNLDSEFERHIFAWCVETYVPLIQLRATDALITTYEHCVSSPSHEFRKIFDYLGVPYRKEVLRTVGKPSSHSRRNKWSGNASAIVTGGNVLEAWRSVVDPRTVRRALDILKLFGLDHIYGLDSLPLGPIQDFSRRIRFPVTH